MAKGGRYLKKNVPCAGKQHGAVPAGGRQNRMPEEGRQNKVPNGGKRKKKVLPIVLIVLAVLLIIFIAAGIWYYNHVLSMITRPGEVTTPSMSAEEEAAMLGTLPAEPLTEPTVETTVETTPEDTWPVVESAENITNVMVVGQAARVGEAHRLSDSMILCSINRDTKTLTMTSFMRDLRVTIPAYAGHSKGFSRMNVCYHLGSHWTQEVKGSMEMLALAVEENFGVHVDHTVEVDFEVFAKIIQILGGATVEIDEDELKYLQADWTGLNDDLVVGTNKLGGYQALAYARMRKVGHGDFERTERQREVITSVLSNLKNVGIMDIHAMFTRCLPLITTDMTNEEMTNYAFEFIPLLKDLNIVSQRIPFDGTYWSTNIGTEQTPDWVIDANLKKNGEMLRESIGMVEAATEPTE